MILALASSIFSGEGERAELSRVRAEFPADLREFEALALETTRERGIPMADYIYVLQSVLSFRGTQPWSCLLERLGDEEFETTCPHCETNLYVAIGSYGYFTSFEDYAVKPEVRKAQIRPREHLPEPGAWLRSAALLVDHGELAARLGYLFGTAECARCARDFDLAARLEEENT